MAEKALTEAGQDWEDQARNYIAWVREPGLDSYWRYRDDLLELIPAAGRATLDVGCGEGRVARDLALAGHRVTGVDASPTLIEAARQAHPGGEYLLADAADLPFPDASFDLVIAYNSLMDVDDLPGAVREAARVLVPGGRLVLSVLHPANTGATLGDGASLAFVVDRSYFEVRKDQQETERNGLRMTFTSYHHPLSSHTAALEQAGFLIEALREPRATGADGSVSALPWHLWMKAVRPAG